MHRPWPILLMVRELGIGGCERDLTKIACRLDRSRFEAHIGCFHPAGLRARELARAGLPIVQFPVSSFLSPSAARGAAAMGRYLDRHSIRLVHAFDVPTDLFGVPIARLYRAPVVIASQLSYRALASPRQARHLLRLIDPLADRILVNCRAMERHMLEDEKVARDRLFLCYNGVDTSEFFPPADPRPRPAALLAGAGGADISLVIGVVAALRPEKSIHTLLDAFARVRDLRPGLRLLILGDGSLRAALEERARGLALAPQCHFESSRPDVAEWMRAIDIFVLPSVSEAFSNALLEAMTSGCAAVGSRVGGTPEQIEDGVNGLLFTPGDAGELAACLHKLILDDDLRRRFGRAAAESARRRFSIETAVERIEHLYSLLLENLDGGP